MGYEIKRFQGDVDEELICPICSGVLEDPLQVCDCLPSKYSINKSQRHKIVRCNCFCRRPYVSTHFVARALRSGSAASPPAPWTVRPSALASWGQSHGSLEIFSRGMLFVLLLKEPETSNVIAKCPMILPYNMYLSLISDAFQ